MNAREFNMPVFKCIPIL